jgi:hypothetical protein
MVLMSAAARAADPGLAVPNSAEINDQKVGSVLVFNYYGSNAANLAAENTRFTITNTNTIGFTRIRLFFVNGASGQSDQELICLTANQTASFLASDVDPGVRGFLIAVAIDGVGCPINYNYLAGESYVKFSSGHAANLPAEAIAALTFNPAACFVVGPTATLNFDGTNYNRLPRALAIDKIRGAADANSMMLILNRIGGNLAAPAGAAQLGTIGGEAIDDLGAAFPFSFATAAPQRVATLSNTFPVTSPPLDSVIPAGRTGWMTLHHNTDDAGLLGACINFNPNSATSAAAFRGGHNLRKLTLSTTNSLIVPLSAPPC